MRFLKIGALVFLVIGVIALTLLWKFPINNLLEPNSVPKVTRLAKTKVFYRREANGVRIRIDPPDVKVLNQLREHTGKWAISGGLKVIFGKGPTAHFFWEKNGVRILIEPPYEETIESLLEEVSRFPGAEVEGKNQ